MPRLLLVISVLGLAALACTASPIEIVTPGAKPPGGNPSSGPVIQGETARVLRVIDGDTIDVMMNGETLRIRYLGMNTTELSAGEACSNEGRQANAALVEGQTVTLVPDRDPQDRYGRELRYVYVGNTFVNAELVRQGWAEAVMYEPNDAHWQELIALEQEAATARRGCHGISDMFDDGRYDR